ncbi:MAG: heme lyase CcmF/NrfE family subunit [Anaerolineae bacterium]|nr:heme lyase CcmF/NrfE family subunit [Thermoflexales bacterium]MDW8394893.1 heme lyase CcmF/NrfE family subunit [Anaerolineae bacterium]
MFADLGHLSVIFAFAACFYAAIISTLGAVRNDDRFVQSGRVALFMTLPLILLGALGLWHALITHDFGVQYVANVSSRSTPLFFRITALWGSQNGSLLFWCLIMAGFVAAAMAKPWTDDKPLLPWVTTSMALVLAFFLFLTLFLANPFVRTDFPPEDGRGLNPLLRHPGMIIHPPMLYSGYTGLLVPFAYCIASLVTRRTDNLWLHASRRWTLVGWAFLTAGLALGGRWAHDVLGWGGYWGWDPSENKPLITWLIATAFLHSAMIQEKRGMFKNWNVFLIMLTFASMFFGTAFIRSGLLTSVHAFAASDIGPYFMIAMLAILVVCAVLWLTRLDTLKSERTLDSAFSREGIFLIQNVLFLSTAFTVFIGTIFPVLSEAVADTKITVGPPFYDQVAVPQLMALVVLMGVAPLLAWHKASGKAVLRQMAVPLAFAVAVMLALYLGGADKPVPLLGFGLCAYTLAQTVAEYVRGVRARMQANGESVPLALVRLAERNQRRYGGYLVHLGVVLLAIGAIGKGFYGYDVIRTVNLNESFTVGGYTFTYRGIRPVQCEFNDCQTVQAMLLMQAPDGSLSALFPSRDFYPEQQHTATIPFTAGHFNEEVYVLLSGWERNGAIASFHVYINPLINWIWIGSVVMILGFLVAYWRAPEREALPVVRRPAVQAAAA